MLTGLGSACFQIILPVKLDLIHDIDYHDLTILKLVVFW